MVSAISMHSLKDGETGPFGNSKIEAIHSSIENNESCTEHKVSIDKLMASNSINYSHPNSVGVGNGDAP